MAADEIAVAVAVAAACSVDESAVAASAVGLVVVAALSGVLDSEESQPGLVVDLEFALAVAT